MDFTNRSSQPAPTFRPAATSEGPSAPTNSNEKKKSGTGKGMSTWARWGSIGLLFCTVGLVVALILLVSFQKSNDESKFISTSKYQAVFLTSGQVYFGHLVGVTNQYYDLRDIYLLQSNSNNTNTSSSNSSSNLTLVKLGCQQIHDPYDQMVINSSQVSFWENLQDGGQVVKAIGQYKQQNPNGQNCTDQSQASSAQSGVQNNSSTNNSSSSTGSSTTGKQ